VVSLLKTERGGGDNTPHKERAGPPPRAETICGGTGGSNQPREPLKGVAAPDYIETPGREKTPPGGNTNAAAPGQSNTRRRAPPRPQKGDTKGGRPDNKRESRSRETLGALGHQKKEGGEPPLLEALSGGKYAPQPGGTLAVPKNLDPQKRGPKRWKPLGKKGPGFKSPPKSRG